MLLSRNPYSYLNFNRNISPTLFCSFLISLSSFFFCLFPSFVSPLFLSLMHFFALSLLSVPVITLTVIIGSTCNRTTSMILHSHTHTLPSRNTTNSKLASLSDYHRARKGTTQTLNYHAKVHHSDHYRASRFMRVYLHLCVMSIDLSVWVGV